MITEDAPLYGYMYANLDDEQTSAEDINFGAYSDVGSVFLTLAILSMDLALCFKCELLVAIPWQRVFDDKERQSHLFASTSNDTRQKLVPGARRLAL